MFGVDNGHRSVSGGLARAAVFGFNDGLAIRERRNPG